MQSTITTLRKVEERARTLAPVDITRNIDRFEYRFHGNTVEMKPLSDSGQPLLMHDLALRQVCSRVGVPYQYLRKCPPALAWQNLNFWIQNGNYNRQALVRTVSGTQVRAVLSDSFTPLDDTDVFPLVLDALGDEEAEVQFLDFSPTHTHCRILFPRLRTEARKNDIIQAGIHISNSEVGQRSLQVESLVYRLVCTNGLTSAERNSMMTARHVGNPARLRDFITNAVTDAKAGTQRLMERFKQTVHHRLDDPLKLIERTAGDGNLSQEQLQRVLSSFAFEGDDATLYGVVNAFTHAAQAESTVEDRYQLERLGSSLLRLSA